MSGEPSYADMAARGLKQTPEEAAAPQPPQIEMSTSASTSSLVDVDSPSVRTVPSDFAEQDVQTDTQANRLQHESDLADEVAAAEDKARRARDKARAKAHGADDWLVSRIASMSDGAASLLAVGNVAAMMGLGAVLGYKAWGLWERRALNAKVVGLGVGLVGLVGLGESIFARAYYKAKGKKQ